MLLAFAIPAVAQAQFTYSISNDTVTITGYSGPDDAVTIPDTIKGLPVTSIGDAAFYYRGLTSVTIPNSVTSIGHVAFKGCDALASVTIGSGVRNIGQEAFYGCKRLTEVAMGRSVTNIAKGLFSESGLIAFEIPDSVEGIGWAAFRSCTNLATLSIGSGVRAIGYEALFGCVRLSEITVNEANPLYRSVDGVLFNKVGTRLVHFPQGRVGSYAIPNGVISLEYSAFLNSRVTSVNIPSSVTNIGELAFSYCALTDVTMGSGITSLGPWAFAYCDLTSVTIPDSVASIGAAAFRGCFKLKLITIGSGVTSIGDLALSYTPSLSELYFRGNAPGIGIGALNPSDSSTVYSLPGTTGWGPTYGGRPRAPWVLPYPSILNTAPGFGVGTTGFGFVISWATNALVVVDAATDPGDPTWSPVSTHTLTNGWSHFSDPAWSSFPARLYRLRSP